MDRSAICLFGIRNYGVSVTGYLNHPSKGLCIWLQQRSFTKQTWPGEILDIVKQCILVLESLAARVCLTRSSQEVWVCRPGQLL